MQVNQFATKEGNDSLQNSMHQIHANELSGNFNSFRKEESIEEPHIGEINFHNQGIASPSFPVPPKSFLNSGRSSALYDSVMVPRRDKMVDKRHPSHKCKEKFLNSKDIKYLIELERIKSNGAMRMINSLMEASFALVKNLNDSKVME